MSYTRARAQRGFSLVELMIALTLGLLLVGGVLSVFAGSLRSNADLGRMARLEEQLTGLLDLISRDVRRAGSTGKPYVALAGGSSPFGLDAPAAYTGEPANSCLTFRYDLNRDGLLSTAAATDERFGYRLKSGMVQIRNAGLACSSDVTPGWENAADRGEVEITALAFAVDTASAGDIDVRAVTVTLSGRLVRDPATTRSFTRRLRVRSDLYTP